MNFNSTVKGSMLEGFYPAGWDFEKIDGCIDAPEKVTEKQCSLQTYLPQLDKKRGMVWLETYPLRKSR